MVDIMFFNLNISLDLYEIKFGHFIKYNFLDHNKNLLHRWLVLKFYV